MAGAEERLQAIELAQKGAQAKEAEPDVCQSEGPVPQRLPKRAADGYFADFKLVFTHPELLQYLVQYGHQRALLLDSTFGTNSMIVCMSHKVAEKAAAHLQGRTALGLTALSTP